MASEFLGRGWSFPVTFDAADAAQDPARSRGIAEASGEDKVRQAIEIILRTAPGERVTRPDFGCGIHELVFDTLGGDMIGRVQSAISSALAAWEPRIDVLGIAAQQDPDDPTRLLIEIDYRIRSTNSRFNLVFPFYVQ
jgi:phage baseplate assembly protein W